MNSVVIIEPVANLDTAIKEFLKYQSNITILHIAQSIYDTQFVILTIFYEENE